jgi:hypothetical protein
VSEKSQLWFFIGKARTKMKPAPFRVALKAGNDFPSLALEVSGWWVLWRSGMDGNALGVPAGPNIMA